MNVKLDLETASLVCTPKGWVKNSVTKRQKRRSKRKHYRLDLLTLVTVCGDRSTLSHSETKKAANQADYRNERDERKERRINTGTEDRKINCVVSVLLFDKSHLWRGFVSFEQ
jgi:hypothetical protein